MKVNIIGIEIVELDDCNHEAKIYYSQSERDIYTYCLEKIIIKDEVKEYELIDLLKKDDTIMDDILSKLTVITSAYDGGTTYYHGSESLNIEGGDLSVFRCNTLEGNKDIYIGTLTLSDYPCR